MSASLSIQTECAKWNTMHQVHNNCYLDTIVEPSPFNYFREMVQHTFSWWTDGQMDRQMDRAKLMHQSPGQPFSAEATSRQIKTHSSDKRVKAMIFQGWLTHNGSPLFYGQPRWMIVMAIRSCRIKKIYLSFHWRVNKGIFTQWIWYLLWILA